MKLTNMILVAALASAPLMANENKKVDPSDLTQVNTFLWTQGGYATAGKGDDKVSGTNMTITGGVAGSITEDISYLGLLEHTRTSKRDFENKDDKTRVRLFGVHSVDWGFISAVGLSADYIHGHKKTDVGGQNLKSNTQAYGVIAKVETGLDWLSLYPNLAYISSKTTISNAGSTFDGDLKSDGYQATLYASIKIDNNGKYMMLEPQYTDTKHFSTQKFEVSYGQPVSSDKKWWVDVKAGYEKGELKDGVLNSNFKSDAQSTVKVGLAYYF